MTLSTMARKALYAASAGSLFSIALTQQVVMFTPGGDDTSVQRIDPILAPGQISQHVHQVFGANGLSPDMSYESLQKSDCTTVGSAEFQGNAADKSVYWHPALYMESNDGSGYIRVPTNGHKMYYLDIGTGNMRSPFEFPHGFRMLAGDPFLRAPASNPSITLWKCSTGGSYNVGDKGGFPTGVSTCSDYPYFYNSVEFPHCWNGDDFNPSSPTAHMAYPEGDVRGGSCPSSHPIRLPHLFMENFFDLDSVSSKVKPNSFVLAQGDNTGFGSHADFFNGWQDGGLPTLLSTCPQPQWGNEDAGTCPSFKSSGPAGSCKLPVTYKENIDNPGKYLPGCNPVIDTNPAPMMSIAPLGVSTNKCNKAAGGGAASSGAPANSAPAGSAQPSNATSSGAAPSISYSGASTVFASTFATLTSSYAAGSPRSGGPKPKHHKHHGHKHAWPSYGPPRR
jgi:hypothetical protein